MKIEWVIHFWEKGPDHVRFHKGFTFAWAVDEAGAEARVRYYRQDSEVKIISIKPKDPIARLNQLADQAEHEITLAEIALLERGVWPVEEDDHDSN